MGLSLLSAYREDSAHTQVPDALIEEIAVSGPFHALRAKIEQRYAGGLAHRASLYTAVPRDADEDTWKTLTG